MPGICSPDTPWSHRNPEPGWIVAPGMQGVKVQPITAGMLTPESLAELMGGPDTIPQRRRIRGTAGDTCRDRRTRTTRTTRCRRRGIRSRGPPPVPHPAWYRVTRPVRRCPRLRRAAPAGPAPGGPGATR